MHHHLSLRPTAPRLSALRHVLPFLLPVIPATAQDQILPVLEQTGTLVCTNLQAGVAATVEWAPTPAGPWSSSWSGLQSVLPASNGVLQVQVPMYYRVRGYPRPRILASPTSLILAEGASSPISIRLSAQPVNPVQVDVVSPDTGAVSLSPGTLVFTSSNWSSNQTVVVQSLQDTDAGYESVALHLSAPGIAPAAFQTTVIDDEPQFINLTANTLVMQEGGSLQLGVSLGSEIGSNTSVSLLMQNTAVATVQPTTLTFNASNWNQYQFCTVTGVIDANTFVNQTVLQVNAPGASPRTVNISVIDNTP